MCAQLKLHFPGMLIYFMSSHFYLAVKTLISTSLGIVTFGNIPIYYQIKLYFICIYCPGLNHTTVILLFLLNSLTCK